MVLNEPRAALAVLPTPLVRARGLERALGGGPILVKRDDLSGFGVAGNKARALEFLIGAALNEECDVVVAAGSPSSNFCAAAAVAARVMGLDCHLLLPGEAPSSPSVNVELAREAGAHLVFGAAASRDLLDDAVVTYAERLSVEGRRPYAVPRGGATATGVIGYVDAVRELADQCRTTGISPGTIVVATGSGGTQAGLVAGRVALGLPWRIIGASVSRPATEMAAQILRLSRECAAALSLDEPPADDVEVCDCRGDGFGVASAEDRVSAQLALAHEGLVLDDTYGAKAMTLFRRLREVEPDAPTVFWHTGGVATALTSLVGRAS